jgi:succinyl-CoA synthetase beta subunit
MNIHEYQGKQLLAKYNIAVPRGIVAFSVEDAVAAAKNLNGSAFVIKAQIHAGGRGAGRFKNNLAGEGGVRVVKTLEDVKKNASEMLGNILVTKQTGNAGKEIKRLYIEDGCQIANELYLSILIDRETATTTMIASTEGGMDIEEVAAVTPEKILKVSIDPAIGFQNFHARKLAFGLGLANGKAKDSMRLMKSLYRAFCELDCSLIEINPLVVTTTAQILALDCKINFDDNALFRHLDIEELRDPCDGHYGYLQALWRRASKLS